MAEECKYYYYDHGYCCELRKKTSGNESVDDDTVHRYCWGYQYDDCPRYKAENDSGGGCFLTSACIEAKGLSDDCHELTVLRSFRDGYMKNTPSGPSDILEYYRIAPGIVSTIQAMPNADEVFDRIYSQLVLPCVTMIEHGQNENAYSLYKDFVQKLKMQLD